MKPWRRLAFLLLLLGCGRPPEQEILGVWKKQEPGAEPSLLRFEGDGRLAWANPEPDPEWGVRRRFEGTYRFVDSGRMAITVPATCGVTSTRFPAT